MSATQKRQRTARKFVPPLRNPGERFHRDAAKSQPSQQAKRKLSRKYDSKHTPCFSHLEPTMDNASQSATGSHQHWLEIDVSAHNRRAHAFAQTGTILSQETDSLYVTSSRGFGRELPPTAFTRPALETRRYTVDASLVQGAFQQERDYTRYNYDIEPQNFTYPTQSRATHLGPMQVAVPVRETDEPVQRRTQLSLPDPLRYRDLHRWGNVWPLLNNDTYLHIGNALLSNEDIWSIVELGGTHCWYRDTVLDAALELISLYYDGEANGIAVASSTTAQCVQFAATAVSEADMNELRAYKTMFEHKKWIFIPLNDGIGTTSAAEAQGTHWALLVIDRPNKRAHYIDGLYNWSSTWQNTARRFALAFQRLLGDEPYRFSMETNAPHQWQHNFVQGTDAGPCGPYVVRMVREMMSYIRNCQILGSEAHVSLHMGLGTGFEIPHSFNSWEERQALVYTLAGVKASQIANERAENHDNTVLGLPRPLGHTELRNLASIWHDAPLFSRNTLTSRTLERHRILACSKNQDTMSVSSQNSSGSSGGLTISNEASEINIQDGYDRARDKETIDEVEMDNQPIMSAADGSNYIRLEEVPSNAFSPYVFIADTTQRSSALSASSSSICNTPVAQNIHDHTSLSSFDIQCDSGMARSDQNTQETEHQDAVYPATHMPM